jgi:hypothetical protein
VVLLYPSVEAGASLDGEAAFRAGVRGGGLGAAAAVPAGVLLTAVDAVERPSAASGPGGLVVAGTGRPAAGDQVVAWHPVAVGPARLRRDGRVQVEGWLADHARLGVLEEVLGQGRIEQLVEADRCAQKRKRLVSTAFVVRCVLMATLSPDADWVEVQQRLAGLLRQVPFSRPWHPVGAETIFRWRKRIPAELFEQLFYAVAGPLAADGPGMRWRGLLVCAVDGTLTPVPDTPDNRRHFGSTGTADDSAPFPQLRAVAVCAAGNRAALGAALGTSGTGEQTLTKSLLDAHPEVFGAGRVFIFDRSWPGADLVAGRRDRQGRRARHRPAEVRPGLPPARQGTRRVVALPAAHRRRAAAGTAGRLPAARTV